MTTTTVFALALAIGLVTGLRSLSAPMAVSLGAHWKWINLENSRLAWMSSTPAAYILVALAVVEIIVDKLPKTPSRKEPLGLIARAVLGGLSGMALCIAGHQSVVIGAVLGSVGGIIGAFVGYEVRTRLVRALKVPDIVIALLEDAVAVGGGLLLVSRF